MSDIPKHLRERVAARAESRCEYCQLPTDGQITWFPVDHVIPRNAGGKTELSNLALTCPRCNAHKWAFETGVDPETGSEVLLFHPRRQKWDAHFKWDSENESPTIIGKTRTGRATIDRLKMNAAEVQEIRKLLQKLGIEIRKR